jgi:hypothetical protein
MDESSVMLTKAELFVIFNIKFQKQIQLNNERIREK